MKRVLKKIFLSLVLVVLLAVLAVVSVFGYFLFKYEKEAKQMVADGGVEAFRSEETTIIYDANGKVITNLIGKKTAYYLALDKIPYLVKRALITSEDRNFYEHSGIDYRAIARATYELVKNKGKITQGASTITQQLARNIFLTHEVSYERKFKEMLIAKELEKTYGKDKILEFYINNIYFANGFYGIQAASKGYFSKSVEKLSLAQMAFLCAIPNNPSLYDPYVNFEYVVSRKDRILKQMFEQGDIEMQLYREALNEKIVLKPAKHTTSNYVETYVRHSATLALMQQRGFEFKYDFDSGIEREKYHEQYYDVYDECQDKLYTGGYRIYTSIDMSKQKELQKIIDEQLSYYQDKTEDGVYTFQGAATCIDNRTGYVVAIVGGRSSEGSGYTINRAYQSHRQPGSTIKPLVVYTPIMERGYTPESIVEDTAVEDGPVNSPNIFEGNISLRYAVEKSKNTTAWKLFEEMTPTVGLKYILNMNFTQIVPEDRIPAAAIGGLTYGVSTVEMAAAYSTIDHDGMFRASTCIKKITDADGNVVIKRNTEEKKVYDSIACRMMTDVLKGVLTRGTGRNYNVTNAVCAAKTGTTNENKDVWFCGYSRYYTTAVWCGYDMPKEINDGFGTTCSGSIWQQFMTYLHEGKELVEFVGYGDDERNEVSSTTGEDESVTDDLSSETEEDSSDDETTEKLTGVDLSTEPTTRRERTTAPTDEETTSTEYDDTSEEDTTTYYEETTTGEDITDEDITDGPTAPGGAEIYSEYWD